MIELYQKGDRASLFGLPTPLLRLVQRFEGTTTNLDFDESIFDHDVTIQSTLQGGVAAYDIASLTIYNPSPEVLRGFSPDLSFLGMGFQPEVEPVADQEEKRRSYINAVKEFYVIFRGQDYDLAVSGDKVFGPFVVFDIQTGYQGREFVAQITGWLYDKAVLQNFKLITIREGQTIFDFFTAIEAGLGETDRRLAWYFPDRRTTHYFTASRDVPELAKFFREYRVTPNGPNIAIVGKKSKTYVAHKNIIDTMESIAYDNDLTFKSELGEFVFSYQGDVQQTAPDVPDENKYTYRDGSLLDNVTVSNYQNIKFNVVFSPHLEIFSTVEIEIDPTTLDAVFFGGLRDLKQRLLVIDIQHNSTYDSGTYTSIVANARGYYNIFLENIPGLLRERYNAHRST